MNIASASRSDGSRILRRGFLLAAALILVGAGSALATQPVDVVFVLDNSGSMKANDPEFLTRRAVKDFVEDFGGFSRVLTEQLQEGRNPRIDLLSYELLSDTERREIAPGISRSGLA